MNTKVHMYHTVYIPLHLQPVTMQLYVRLSSTSIRIVLDPWIQQYVCMVITCSKSMDQPGKVANPARGQLNRENEYFPVRVRA